MSSLFVLIPLGGVFAAVSVWFFLQAIRGRQFEDLDEIGRRMPDQDG